MKILKFLPYFILIFGIPILIGCTKSNNNSPDTSDVNNTSGYFPMEVGKYWKYKCVYSHGSTSSSTTKEESEVLIQIISKKTDNMYVAKVTKDQCNTYLVTINVHENGDISADNGKLLLSKSQTSMDPDSYQSILRYPVMTGSPWMSSGKVRITESNGTLEAKYDGKEIWASNTVASSGTCEHNFAEKFEKDKGMTYTNYIRFVSIKNYLDGNYIYSGTYSSWIYTLIDSGVSDIIDNSRSVIWTAKNNIISGAQLSYAASFSINDNGYIGVGGNNGFDNFNKSFYKYDSNTDGWEPIASLPENAKARKYSSGFSINGKGYICGGLLDHLGYTYFKELWMYNPETDIWSQKKDIPRAGGMVWGVGFSIGLKGYAGLGFADFTKIGVPYGAMNDFYEYDAEKDEWKQLKNFPGKGRLMPIGFGMNGKGYIGLGYSGTTYYKDFWEYDPASDSWTQMPDFPGTGRKDAIGYGRNGYCYVGMGKLNDLYIFDTNTKTWSAPIVQECMAARTGAFSFLINNKIFYGSGDGSYSDLWEYTVK